jgi:DegV family protein with EDD domain
VELTVENTAIVVDSTADFPEAPERFPNWRVVPLYVRFGDESFRDYVELSPEQFYARLRTSKETPSTSQPTPGDFLTVYEGLAAYERILSIHIAGKLSGTIESARAAARELGGERVRTIDSESASAAIAMLGLAIQRRLERGTSDEEVDALVERYRREARLLFTVDTLEYLARGGRIGRARAWAGELLNIKPILSIEDGEVLPVKRVRGNRKAFLEFASRFESSTVDRASLCVGIAHAEAPEKAEALRKLVRDKRPAAEIEIVTTLGPVVGTHAGPGTVGFFWYDDDQGADEAAPPAM